MNAEELKIWYKRMYMIIGWIIVSLELVKVIIELYYAINYS